MKIKQEILKTDLTSWAIGPYHGALSGPLRVHLKLDGEIIVAGNIETGFLHRGLEKTFELHSWLSAIPYSDRLDSEGAFFGELSICLAVEEIAGIPVPARAQAIRLILSELSRISGHLGYLARVARAVVSDTMVHYVLRDRERILDLFELLSGARFNLSFLRYGGVASEVTEGFIERAIELCDLMNIRLKEYNDLFSYNEAFLKRTVGIGNIAPPRVHHWGITGPNARASGWLFDVRKDHPYSGYEAIDFEIPVFTGEAGGDVHTRFLIRLREIHQSVRMLRQLLEHLPPGDFLGRKVDRMFAPPAGEAYVRVESSRGLLGCFIASDGGPKPTRVQFRPPSLAHLMVGPELLEGRRLEDLPVILASLDIGVAEVDR